MLHRFTWLSFDSNTFESAVMTDQLQVDQVMHSSHVALPLMQDVLLFSMPTPYAGCSPLD
jgi:hypothetical protein